MSAKHITLLLLPALLLAACGTGETPMPTPDIGAIQTAAAQTVMADILATQNAAASLTPLASPTAEATQPPAETPTVTVTLTLGTILTPGAIGTPAGLCDVFRFVADVNYPDDTPVTPGQDFLKTWRIRNVGACTWGAGYQVVYGGYTEKMSGLPQAITSVVQPNEEVEVSVQFKAPTKPGTYVSAWTMANPQGVAFFDERGKPFYIRIVVR